MNFSFLIDQDIDNIKNQTVSIIGGGGKSSLLKQLAHELARKNLRVIITSTTKFQPFPKIEMVLQEDEADYLAKVDSLLAELKIALVAKEFYKDDNKLVGVNRQVIQELQKRADTVLIEADGSRQRCLKTHAEHEPVIPPSTKTVIIICGADIVGAELNEKNVHRAELFSKKWEMPIGARLTPDIIAREFLSPYSYLKNVPLHAKISILINKSDKNIIGGKLLAEKLLKKCEYPIFLGSLKSKKLRRVTLNSNF